MRPGGAEPTLHRPRRQVAFSFGGGRRGAVNALGDPQQREDPVMTSRVFLASLLAGAISTCALTAHEPPRPSRSDDPTKATQQREDQVEQPLAGLLGRCQKMLDLQTAVYDGTKGLHKAIEGNADKKPRPRDRQAALKLSDDEKAIIAEATKTIDLLNAEGSAVAFTEAFQELREDLKRVQSRLASSDVGPATQALQQDIIDTLKEMVAGFRKR